MPLRNQSADYLALVSPSTVHEPSREQVPGVAAQLHAETHDFNLAEALSNS